MSTDLVVATPTFLDLTFVGLDAMPALGEERFAGDLVRSPGGGAITAVGAARLGLSVVIAAPLGDDAGGDLLREALERDGVGTVGRSARRTPVTVVLPVGDDRAMVTVDPGVRASRADVAALAPRAVAVSLDQLYCVPPGARAYVTCGDEDARAFAGRPPAGLAGARALFVSDREALALTGADDVEAAAHQLSGAAQTVVVTRGADGALACAGGVRVDAEGFDVGEPLDTTGAGDLLVAAYVWADLNDLEPEDCLRWAVLYAALSVTEPTGVGGAVSGQRLREEGQARGLRLPPRLDAEKA
jgi:ribokinase